MDGRGRSIPERDENTMVHFTGTFTLLSLTHSETKGWGVTSGIRSKVQGVSRGDRAGSVEPSLKAPKLKLDSSKKCSQGTDCSWMYGRSLRDRIDSMY